MPEVAPNAGIVLGFAFQHVVLNPPSAEGLAVPQVFVGMAIGTDGASTVPVPTTAAAPVHETRPIFPAPAPVSNTQLGVAVAPIQTPA